MSDENKTKEEQVDELHIERLKKCVPIAKEVIKLMGQTDFILGDDANDKEGVITEEAIGVVKDVSGKVLNLMKEKDVNWADRGLVMQLVFQAYDQTKTVIGLEH